MASSKALAMIKQNSSGSINNAGPASSNGSSSTSIHSHGRESRASSKDSNLGNQPNSTSATTANNEVQVNNHGDSDLFSFLSAMHLNQHQLTSTQQLVTSRKRKILDHGDRNSLGGSSSGKFNGLRPPALRRNSDDDLPLHTPQCSQSGYADEEDRHIQLVENANAAAAAASANESHSTNDDESPPSPILITQQQGGQSVNNLSDTQLIEKTSSETGNRIGYTRNRHSSNNISLSLVTPHALMSEIDENLAADFDGSFSGLGVDINASSYSMSEALLALPNLSISSSGHIFKQEILSPTPTGLGKDSGSPIMYFKEEPNQSPISMVARKGGGNTKIGGGKTGVTGVLRGSGVHSKRHFKIASANAQNLEALDLSNDEAHLPETSGNHAPDGKAQSTSSQKISFIGSVSRESSCEGGIGNTSRNQHLYNTTQQILLNLHPPNNAQSINSNYNNAVNLSGSHPNLSLAGASVPAIPPSSQESTTKKNQTSFGGQIHLGSVTGHSTTTTKTHKVILPLQSSNDPVNQQPHTDLLPIVPSIQSTGIITNKKMVNPTTRNSPKGSTNEQLTAGNNETTTYTVPNTLLNGPGMGLDEPNDTFQYILAAATSNATKISEPSITYLNQGQAYELRLKKLGDLSPYRGNKNRHLRCKVRICFHERRLQYMEIEQLAEWSSKHVNERVLDLDVPLSYGIIDPYVPPAHPGCDPTQLNVLTFRWDPTRDTGVFVKVNCISTEFTPKKHGGEKGVPFRLQVETYTDDSGTSITSDSGFDYERRLHAASCILQIFKLKGADRKHKQDRDKIQKRPFAEQEKFSPSYECTVLSDLPAEHIYIPLNNSANGNTSTSNTSIPLPPLQMGQGVNSSRSNTPNRVISNHPTNPSVTGSQPVTTTTPLKRAESISPSFQSVSKPVQKNISTGVYQPVNSSDCVPVLSRNGSPALYTTDQKFSIDTNAFVGANNLSMSGAETPEQQMANDILPQITSTSTPEMVSHWLGKNRYTDHLNSFQHYNGRDILRLLREEIISLCGIVDGIRLYNDLHMAVVAPVCTFYVASKECNEFSALFLEEATAKEFINKLAQSIGVPPSVFRNLYIIGPHGILIKVTDSVVQYTKPESVFQFSLRSPQNHPSLPVSPDLQNSNVDVILENTTPSHGVTNEIMNAIHQQTQDSIQLNNSDLNGEQHGLENIDQVNRDLSPYPRGGGSLPNENSSVDNHDNSSVNRSSVPANILQ